MSELGGQARASAGQEGHYGPWSLLLRYLASWFAKVGDEPTRHATSRVLKELAIFYVLIIVGFLLLYLTWRSNNQLKHWKSQVQQTIAQQRGRSFEPSDAAKLYMG